MTWRPADRDDRSVAVLWASCAGLTLLLRPLWIAATAFLPACPWHAWTGWPCPGCGTTRAMLRLLHADALGALAANPLAALGAVAFVAGGLAAPVWLACGGQRPYIAAPHRPAWLAGSAVAVAVNWTWLAVSGV